MIQHFFQAGTPGKLAITQFGTGSADIVMLHGVTRRWQTFMPILPSLVPFWKVHCVDFRGHGQSEHVDAYRVVDYADDISTWLSASFTKPVWLYGHSLGAMVAADVGARLPENVAGVILEDPPLHTMGTRIGDSILKNHFETIQGFAGKAGNVFELAAILAEQKVYDPTTDSHIRLGDLRNATNLRFTITCLQKLDPRVLVPIVASEWLQGYEVADIFSALHCPCLLLQADEKSGGMLTDQDSAEVESLSRDLTRIKFNDCGHSIHWTETEKLANHVLAFLAGIESE